MTPVPGRGRGLPAFVFEGSNTVSLGPRVVELGGHQRAILELLVSKPGVPIGVDEIAALWGRKVTTVNSVRTEMHALRENLKKLSVDDIIHTGYGNGYRLGPPDLLARSGVLTFEPARLVLNAGIRTGQRGERPFTLSGLQTRALATLMENPGRTVSHRDLALALAEPGCEPPDQQAVSRLIRSLRRPMEADGESQLVHAVYGEGYILRFRSE